MKYNEGDIINGFELVERFRDNSHSRGVFICPYCEEWFESPISTIASASKVSCGCKKSTGNLKHGKKGTPVYRTWQAMKKRCTNPSAFAYERYGGRGITIFPVWLVDFVSFYEYVTALPSFPGESQVGLGKYTIDRVNNDGNYEPGNLRWATSKEQRLNQ